jgi:hypothetical protein
MSPVKDASMAVNVIAYGCNHALCLPGPSYCVSSLQIIRVIIMSMSIHQGQLLYRSSMRRFRSSSAACFAQGTSSDACDFSDSFIETFANVPSSLPAVSIQFERFPEQFEVCYTTTANGVACSSARASQISESLPLSTHSATPRKVD